MEESKARIKTICTVVMVILLILIGCLLVNGVYDIAKGMRLLSGTVLFVDNTVAFPYWYLRPFFAAIVLGFLAYMFLTIRRSLNPFTQKTATQLKVLAAVLPLVMFLPAWLHDFFLVISGEQAIIDSTLINSTALILIVVAAIFCLALIVQYGAQLHEDSEEII